MTANTSRQKFGYGILFCLLFISSFCLSGRAYPTLDLDPSWQAVIEYAAAKHWRFGQDIVFTYGPLGYLNLGPSQGGMLFQRACFAVIWSGATALSALAFASRLPWFPRALFLGWFLLFSYFGMLEQHLYLILVCLTIYLLDEKWPSWLMVPIGIFLATVALIKFTCFLCVVVILSCVLTSQFLRREVKPGLLLGISTLGGLLLLWVLAGQQISDLPLWISRSMEISSGYNLAMSVAPQFWPFITGIAAWLLFGVTVCYAVISHQKNVRNFCVLLVITLYVFLVWKHSFVRADGHVMIFFWTMPSLYVGLFFLRRKDKGQVPVRVLAASYAAMLILCIVGLESFERQVTITKVLKWPTVMLDRVTQFSSLLTGSIKGQYMAYLPAEDDRQQALLPQLSSIVGQESIDVLNYSQWAALANNLNYQPRPVVQGYSAYTKKLQDINLAHYTGSKAPSFVLMDLISIDHRFPAMDDGPALLHILNNYVLVGEEKKYLLLKKQLNQPLQLKLVHEQTLHFGEPMVLSGWNRGYLFAEVVFRPTVWGKIANVIFQTSPLAMDVDAGAFSRMYRIIPAMAERPFLLSPVVNNNAELATMLNGRFPNVLQTLQFSCSSWARGQYQNEITVKLYQRF